MTCHSLWMPFFGGHSCIHEWPFHLLLSLSVRTTINNFIEPCGGLVARFPSHLTIEINVFMNIKTEFMEIFSNGSSNNELFFPFFHVLCRSFVKVLERTQTTFDKGGEWNFYSAHKARSVTFPSAHATDIQLHSDMRINRIMPLNVNGIRNG